MLRFSGLDNLELHHIVVNSWENGVDAQQVRGKTITKNSMLRCVLLVVKGGCIGLRHGCASAKAV